MEKNCNAHWTGQVGAGIMLNNQLSGSVYKVDDGLTGFNNSGFFASGGIRYNTRKDISRTNFFAGLKIINGYFNQEARQSEGNYRINRSGYFLATGIESGVTLKVSNRLCMDIGLQYSPVIYSAPQASSIFSILPGIGAIAALQGILTLKYFLF